MPKKLASLVLLAAVGELGHFGTKWRGWRITGGKLCSPDGGGMQFEPGEVLSVPLLHMRIAALQAKVRDERKPDHGIEAIEPRRSIG